MPRKEGEVENKLCPRESEYPTPYTHVQKQRSKVPGNCKGGV